MQQRAGESAHRTGDAKPVSTLRSTCRRRIQKRCAVPTKCGIAMAATASFVPVSRASVGVRRLPIAKPAIAAIPPEMTAVAARRRAKSTGQVALSQSARNGTA